MTGRFFSPDKLSITSKLLILVAVVCLSFATIIALAIANLHQVKSQSTDVINTQISALINNSTKTREVSQLFNQIHLLNYKLHELNPNTNKIESDLLGTIESIKLVADSPELKSSILDLRTAVIYAVDLYRLIDSQIVVNSRLEQGLKSTLDQFEVDASEWEFELLGAGEDTLAAEQLYALIDGYREMLEQVISINASQRSFLVSHQQDAIESTTLPYLKELNDRFSQIPTSYSVARQYRSILVYQLEELLLANQWFYQQLNLFSNSMNALAGQEAELLSLINRSSDKTNQQSQLLMDDLNHLISSSSFLILSLSLTVMLTLALAVLMMIRKSIKRPIAQIVKGIDTFSQGQLLNRIELQTNDEFATISNALNNMAGELHQSYTELKDSEDKFYQVFENEINALLIFDQDTGQCLDANRVALDLYGVGLDEIKKLHVDDLERPQEAAEGIRKEGNWVQMFHCKQDGTLFPVEVHTGMFIRQGQRFLFKSVRDMTEHLRLQNQQEHTLALLEATIESTNEGIVAITNAGTITNYNRHFVNVFDLDPQLLDSRNIRDVLPKIIAHLKDKNDFLNMIRSASERPDEIVSSDVLELNDGRMFECHSHLQMLNGSAVGRVWNFRDVSEYFNIMQELRDKESRLAHIAHHDSLTGLPNRLLFLDRLEHAIHLARRSQEQLAVFFIDLDRFKSINDSLGHDAGDMLLKSFAERLRSAVRQNDTIARLGGDEFTVILESIDGVNDAATVAGKILETLKQPFTSDEYQFYVTSSIGISFYPQDGATADLLLKNADAAMYKSKDEGRNNYHFYKEEMTDQAFERVVLEANLREALETDQFEVFYQPQIDLASGAFLGAEALVRWQHPSRGLLAPCDFLSTAEETGLIDEVDRWVFQHVCQHVADWEKAGVDLEGIRFAVNLSGRQLSHQNLPETYQEIMTETGCNPRYLELEISEGFVMHQPDASMDVLERLKSLGIELSIDDFGTGYSSLAYLKRMPLSKLKIDRSFVQDIVDDPNDAAISKSVIALGHSMNLKVVAEGVETGQQKAFLKQQGCDMGQGYLFSRPVDAIELAEIMDTYGVVTKRAI